MAESELYTLDALAAYLGVSLYSLRYWRAQGTGPQGFRLGRRVVYRRAEVERWLREQEAAGTPAGAA